MTQILRIDSSSRLQGSHSRGLADYFQSTWINRYPDDEIVIRDLVKTPIPHISDVTIAGYYTPTEKQTEAMKIATKLSDKLISELQSSDILLLSVPMYNFSVPSALKAWIDQIVRINRTFAYDGTNFSGLVTVKRVYVICAYGASGYTNDGPFSAFNFLQPYLTSLFSFLGIPEIEFFNIQATTSDETMVMSNTNQVKKAIDDAIAASTKYQLTN